MKKTTIEEQLERVLEANKDDNFVSLGVAIANNDGIQQGVHSALFICLKGDLYIFHFLPEGIYFHHTNELPNIGNYYHKKLEFMSTSPSVIEAFIAHCKSIQAQSNLEFGFIFDGSYYNPITHKHFSKSGLPELSTCVGFCINVLSGWIIEKELYLEISDWNSINVEHPSFNEYYRTNLSKFPNINQGQFKAHHKRITPNECTASAYFGMSDITIAKAKIDSIIAKFNEVVSKKEIPVAPPKAS